MANQDQNYLGPRTHPPNLQKSTSSFGAKLHYQYTGKEQKTSSSKDESRVHHSESRSPRLSRHLTEDHGSGSTLDQRLSRQLTVDYGGGSTVDQRSQLETQATFSPGSSRKTNFNPYDPGVHTKSYEESQKPPLSVGYNSYASHSNEQPTTVSSSSARQSFQDSASMQIPAENTRPIYYSRYYPENLPAPNDASNARNQKKNKFGVRTMSNSCKEFSISENVKNISRFVDVERYYTNLEDRFNIPWRMSFERNNYQFGFYLRCEKEECEARKWSIETEYTLKLVSQNGKSLMNNGKYTFEKPYGIGWNNFISWKDLENDYVVDDSLVVEAHVKVFNILESPCTETRDQKTILLNHTVHNISSIKEGGIYTTNIETHFKIPWRMRIQRFNGFFGIFLRCEKKRFDSKNWTIEVEYVLTLKSSNGQKISSEFTYIFKDATGYGFSQFIRWDDMERKFAVNDSIIIEASVKIIKMTGFEERPFGKLSGIVIPVGDREYSMEEWMEMAFGC